jgi:cytochrome P450 family 4 subfamily V
MSFSPAPAIASAVVLASAVFMFMLDIDPNDVLSFSVAKISELTRFLGGQELLTNVFREVTMVLKNLSYLQLLSITTVILLFMYLLPRYLEFRRCYALIEKMPGPPVHPVPFVGHAKVILDIDKRNSEYGSYALVYQMMMGIYELYGSEKLLRMWLGCRPFIMLFDPESVESILSSPSLTDKAQEYSFLKPWLGEGLVTSQRGKWKNRRKILTPAFHFKILHDFLPVMNEQAHILVKKVEGLWRDGKTTPYPNLLELITLCTLDVICETAMGTSVHAQTSDQSVYVKSLHQVSSLTYQRRLVK